MTKAESHYLNCADPNCEQFGCVARRDYESTIDALEDSEAKLRAQLAKYKAALESVKMNYEQAHLNATSSDSCGDKVFAALTEGDAKEGGK